MSLLFPFEIEADETYLLPESARRMSRWVLFFRTLPILLWTIALAGLWFWSQWTISDWAHIVERLVRGLALLTVALVFPALFYIMLEWFRQIYIVTNKRVMWREGIIATRNIQTPIAKIQVVTLADNFTLRLFNMGNVLIETAGSMGDIRFDLVSNPVAVQEAILQEKQRYEEEIERLTAQEIRHQLRSLLAL